MKALRARVHGKRIIIDEPVELPDGTELDLLPLSDGMTPEERARLDAVIGESEEEIARGESVSAEELWARLRAVP